MLVKNIFPPMCIQVLSPVMIERRNSSPWNFFSISKTLAWPPLDSTCVGLSALLGPTSRTVSDIWEFLWWFRVVEIYIFAETSQKVHPQSICDRHEHIFDFFTIDRLPLLWSSFTDVQPFLNSPHHLNTLVRLITLSPCAVFTSL